MASSRTILLAAVVCVLVMAQHEASAATSRCPDVCTLQFDPVCGRTANGKTMEFSNSCFLGIYKCNNPGVIVSSTKGSCR